jgi:DNA-binding MarR family transcriptional regulator
MEAARLVERCTDPQDSRITRLRLTPGGEYASIQARTVLGDLNEQLTKGFTADELATVARRLTQCANSASTNDVSDCHARLLGRSAQAGYIKMTSYCSW